jgi:hypothetical protein
MTVAVEDDLKEWDGDAYTLPGIGFPAKDVRIL